LRHFLISNNALRHARSKTTTVSAEAHLRAGGSNPDCPHGESLDYFAPLAMTAEKHEPAFSRRNSPELCTPNARRAK
jgi:hypothetical protein